MPMSLGSISFGLEVMSQPPVYRDMGDGRDGRRKMLWKPVELGMCRARPDLAQTGPDVGRFQRLMSARLV